MTRPTRMLFSLLAVGTALSLLVVAVAPDSGEAARHRRQARVEVVGGQDVPDGYYPFVAAVGYADPSGAFLWDNFFCGGSLIAPSEVLTAAHCVLGTTPDEIAVVVGRTLMSSSQGEVRHVSGYTVHPEFNRANAANDVAVIFLDQPVNTITPITYIGAGDESLNVPGTVLTLAGWGNNSPKSRGPNSYPDRLQELQLTVVNDTTCAKKWRKVGYSDSSIWPLFICTTPGRFGVGDSGAPLFAHINGTFVQTSLVSGSYDPGATKRKRKRNKKSGKRVKDVPDYGPQLSEPEVANFIRTTVSASPAAADVGKDAKAEDKKDKNRKSDKHGKAKGKGDNHKKQKKKQKPGKRRGAKGKGDNHKNRNTRRNGQR